MKVVLSRKGFESQSGGYPSPILSGGRLLSLPIPLKHGICYSDIMATKTETYYDIMLQLKPKIKIEERWQLLTRDTQCHLDPDLVESTYLRLPGWKPMIGQIKAAQGHLAKQGVEEGDLFLFFGLFRRIKNGEGSLYFDHESLPVHVIFGYLQIGQIHRVNSEFEAPQWMEDYPHVRRSLRRKNNNTVYEATKELSLNPELPGAGVLKYSESPKQTKTKLTKNGLQHGKWDLPAFFRQVEISYHGEKSAYGWKKDYFQSAAKGQEFVIEENQEVTDWARQLIERTSVEKNEGRRKSG